MDYCEIQNSVIYLFLYPSIPLYRCNGIEKRKIFRRVLQFPFIFKDIKIKNHSKKTLKAITVFDREYVNIPISLYTNINLE